MSSPSLSMVSSSSSSLVALKAVTGCLSVDDLKHWLLQITLELESTRTNAMEEIIRSEEKVNELNHLLKVTVQERDEAKEQLQMLLSKITLPDPVDNFPIFPYLQPEGSPMVGTRGNSSITGSESVSETLNYQSYVSSPVESLFETVSSPPELANMNMADSQQPFLYDFNGFISQGPSSGMSKYDPTSAIFDSLRVKKPLPEKGKFLQAVMEAGPLLQTLLVAGPLPRWRNPPPLQPLHLPSLAVRNRDSETFTQKAIGNPNYLVHGSANSLHHENLHAESQVYPASALNFSNTAGLCLRKRPMLSSCGSSSYYGPSGKRQKPYI